MNWSSVASEELLRACLGISDPGAWQEFIQRFRPVIAGTVLRTARRFGAGAPELIEDLIQETYLKLCANRCRVLREFKPQSEESIFGFLKTVAYSVAQDHFRSGLAAKRGGGQAVTRIDSGSGGAGEGHDCGPQVERDILLREIDEILTEITDPATRVRDKTIFWMYYRHGMTSRAIAAIPGIGLSQKGVESTLHRLATQVRERIAASGTKGPKGKASTSSF